MSDDPENGSMDQPPIGWTTPNPSAPPSYPSVPETAEGPGLYPDVGFNITLLNRTKTYMECPICFELLIPPIYQCQNGHIICSGCVNKVEFCGECRIPLGDHKIRHVALEYICQSVEIKCPNSGDGCMEKITVEHLSSHLEVCPYGAIPFCSQFFGHECVEKVSTTSAVDHLVSAHQGEQISQSKFSLKLIAPLEVFQSVPQPQNSPAHHVLAWNPIIVSTDSGDKVLLKCGVSNGHISLSSVHLGHWGDHRKHRVKFQIDSSSNNARFEWTGGLLSFRSQLDEFTNVNVFRIPTVALEEYCKRGSSGENGQELCSLKLRIAFWKLSDDEDDGRPYQDCFNTPAGQKIPLDKLELTYTSISAPMSANINLGAAESRMAVAVHSTPNPSPNSPEHYFPDISCRNCNTTGLFGAVYRCLHCEFTFFCQRCVEVNREHGSHLMVRFTSPEQAPFAEVVFECAAGELN